jgi:hypothetical protein
MSVSPRSSEAEMGRAWSWAGMTGTLGTRTLVQRLLGHTQRSLRSVCKYLPFSFFLRPLLPWPLARKDVESDHQYSLASDTANASSYSARLIIITSTRSPSPSITSMGRLWEIFSWTSMVRFCYAFLTTLSFSFGFKSSVHCSVLTPLPLAICTTTVIRDLEHTGLFDKMDKEADEDEHSLEMHLPYIRHVFSNR